MLDGAFASLYTSSITIAAFLAACLVSVVLGLTIALVYRKISGESGTMVSALTVLPFLVQLVILMVNGNLGTGVAVAGAFSLVRFRSAPGSARDIMAIFLAMTVGLCCGMGYCTLAVLAALITCGILLMQKRTETDLSERNIQVTIPENLDYNTLFSDLFAEYTTCSRLLRVKTVNMGSLYRLYYQIRMKENDKEKELLDAMRCRNGNLEISCGIPANDRQGEIL